MSTKLPAEKVFRAWSQVPAPAFDEEAGRARFLERFARGSVRHPARGLVVMAATAVLAGAFALAWWRPFSTVTFTVTAGAADAASEGQAGAWLAPGSASELPLAFSEGSELVMAAGSRGRVEELGRTGASFLLERGEVRARVVHRANTSWRFLAGPFEVWVTGTALRVDWDPTRERFAVRVDAGSVAVRGPNVGGLQVVRAGEQCVVDLPSRMTHLSPVEQAGDLDALVDAGSNGQGETRAAAVEPPPAPRAAVPPPAAWIKLAEGGDYDAAYAAASSAGLAVTLRASSADALLRLAQVARLSGHRDTEREALVTCRRRFPGSELAAVAAYELGRSSPPSDAAGWFDTYLGERPGGPLAREAAGRLVEARTSAGDDRGARDAATRYIARYPDGPHASLARRLLAGAHD